MMKWEPILRERAPVRVIRPPELWEADGHPDAVGRLLDVLIRAPLSKGVAPEEVTLAVANVSLAYDDRTDADKNFMSPAGDFVAVTVSSVADLGVEATWPSGARPPGSTLDALSAQFIEGRVRLAYIRHFASTCSLTVYLDRLIPPR